jgi:phage regulator Rha-like protein
MDPKEVVLASLKESGVAMKSKEIAEASGLEKTDIDKAIKALKKEEKIISPKACYYSLK